MHAGFPSFTPDLQKVLQLGAKIGQDSGEIPRFLEQAGGRLLATGMAALVRLGFGFIMRDSLLNRQQADKAEAFFNDNFVINDPLVPGGKRYYQGKFLIRTRKPEDEMNVLVKFCPRPEKLYRKGVFGTALDPMAVVTTETLSENQAKQIENDPDKVDLVILFKDIQSILGLMRRTDVDIVGLLLENIVQLRGNVGHLFKLGAIGTDIELALGQHHPA